MCQKATKKRHKMCPKTLDYYICKRYNECARGRRSIVNKEIVKNEKLYTLRKKKGETQAEVAKNLGISKSAYNMYETGKRTPSDNVKRKIAEHFNRTVQFIFFS